MFGWLTNESNAACNVPVEWKYDDLPTFSDGNQHEIVATTSEKILNWLQGTEGWSTVVDENGILVEEMNLPGNNFVVVRAHKKLHGVDVGALLKATNCDSFEEKSKLYDDLLGFDVIDEYNEQTNLCYSKYKTPFGIANRDFVTLRNFVKLDDHTYLLTCQAVNYSGIPFGEGFVRGANTSGRLIKVHPSDPTTVDVVTVDHVDPKGSIPSFIVNTFKKRTGERLLKMESIYKLI